jgi:hypothetical protein
MKAKVIFIEKKQLKKKITKKITKKKCNFPALPVLNNFFLQTFQGFVIV